MFFMALMMLEALGAFSMALTVDLRTAAGVRPVFQ
jgi:hypothetical protein